MAHEELKALYEIDKQHSDTPWEFWEIFDTSQKDWVCEFKFEPSWLECCRYRRKTGAPVWPVSDDAEDARKWRELEAYLPTSTNSQAVVEKISQLRSPALIQGYTAEQWQTIIDGEFFCEFGHWPGDYKAWGVLEAFHGEEPNFMDRNEDTYSFCRPLRTKGVRQPWFGGECPVDPNARVSYVLRDGYKDQTEAGRIRWEHKAVMSDIVEFIEL